VDEPPSEFGDDFLDWLRVASEAAWSRVEERPLSDADHGGAGWLDWRRGTRWTGGLSETAIAEAEHRYELRFPAQHRLFLRRLHSTKPWCSGASYADGGDRLRPWEAPGFYDWVDDEPYLRAATDWLVDGLVVDPVADHYWQSSWGSQPKDTEELRARMTALVEAAPPLIPIYAHRYVVGDGSGLVLSVHGQDVIVYGRDLRDYLLRELGGLLGIDHTPEPVPEVPDIPFWRHFIQA
jgi:hypothetical protein